MKHIARTFLASSLLLATAAFAQTPPAPPPRGDMAPPPRADIAALLNLDATRAEQVRAIMKVTYEKMDAVRTQMEAIRKETDLQLAAVLTPEEFQKLQATMARQQPYRGPPPQQRAPAPPPYQPQPTQPPR